MKVQVYRVLGSKVSSVVAEYLEHSQPSQAQASQADLCPSVVRLNPAQARVQP